MDSDRVYTDSQQLSRLAKFKAGRPPDAVRASAVVSTMATA